MNSEEFKNSFETLTWQHKPGQRSVNLRQYAGDIVELFEDLLERNDITIPDDDREGEEDEARIYGMTYDDLLEDTISVLQDMVYEIGVMVFERGNQNAEGQGVLGRMGSHRTARHKHLPRGSSNDAGS